MSVERRVTKPPLNHSVLNYLEKFYQTHKPTMAFQARTLKEWRIWQQRFREKIVELFGCFPSSKSPLKSHTLSRKEEAFYFKEKVVFESMPGIQVIGYLLIPKDVTFPRPALLCPPGHGRGKVDSVEKGAYCDYGVRFAEEGYITFAMDHIGFGERAMSDRENYSGDWRDDDYSLAVNVCHFFGMSIMGFRIYDLIRSLDYLQTRSEVAKDRIGCIGLSLGGELTLFLAALEERVKVAIICGWLSTYKETILSSLHCTCAYIPGLLKYGEMYDIAGLIAPRPLQIQTGKRDRGFPTSGALKAYKSTKEVYQLLKAEDSIDIVSFDGAHAWSEKEAFLWIKKWL